MKLTLGAIKADIGSNRWAYLPVATIAGHHVRTLGRAGRDPLNDSQTSYADDDIATAMDERFMRLPCAASLPIRRLSEWRRFDDRS